MSTPLYRTILRQALTITTRYKKLWILGFIATGLGIGGEYEFLINQYYNFSDGGWSQAVGIFDIFQVENLLLIKKVLLGASPWFYVLVAAFLIFVSSFAWILASAQGGLVKSVADGVEGRKVSVWQSFIFAGKSFWGLLAILLSTRLLAIFVTAVIGLPLISVMFVLGESAATITTSLVFFILLLPLFILFSLISKLAFGYFLIIGLSWRRSLVQSFRLFSDHWLVCLELALIMLPISLLASFIFIPIATFLALPFLLFGLVVAKGALAFSLMIFLVLSLIIFLVLLILFVSALSTFQNTVWTVLFLKIKDAPQQSKLVRILHDWREKYRS